MAGIVSELIGTAVKSAVAAVVLLVFARLMGKKQISQLTFFDYAAGISIGSVAAAVSVEKNVPLCDGIVSLAVWAAFPIVISLISMRSITARRIFEGRSAVLVQRGKIVEKSLRKARFTVNDLLEELRNKDIFSIAEVEFAILETNGRLSVMKKSGGNAPAPGRSVSANVIIDGKLMRQNMERFHIEGRWVEKELHRQNIRSPKDVLLAVYDGNGSLYVDRKHADPEDLNAFL